MYVWFCTEHTSFVIDVAFMQISRLFLGQCNCLCFTLTKTSATSAFTGMELVRSYLKAVIVPNKLLGFLEYHHHSAACKEHYVVSTWHRRRIKTEEKAKVVADVWDAEFIQFFAVLAIILFFKSSWCNVSYSSNVILQNS